VFFVFAEDLCSCLVGPFETREEAEGHLAWCRDERHDGATMEVVSRFIAERLSPDMTMTPALDRASSPVASDALQPWDDLDANGRQVF
jgi:hypothetical protein